MKCIALELLGLTCLIHITHGAVVLSKLALRAPLLIWTIRALGVYRATALGALPKTVSTRQCWMHGWAPGCLRHTGTRLTTTCGKNEERRKGRRR
jgi:hypothetical protein